MTFDEIKKAIDEGKKVKWSSSIYDVEKHGKYYYVVCSVNGYTTGLGVENGKLKNERPSDFYISRRQS